MAPSPGGSTFGIEEEFALLDPQTLSTVDAATAAVAELSKLHEGHVGYEFYESQVEYSSPVFSSLDEARTDLVRFRADLADWAAANDVIAVSSGTPFRTTTGGTLHDEARYERISADIAGLTTDHQINGMHVHIGIPDRAAGVRASDALRPWLPVLLALSSNSPYWQGMDTGFASWRSLHGRRWTTQGIPPAFGTVDAHDRTRAALAGVGATSDGGTVNWNVRLSTAHPTVETRVCDGQLDTDSTIALAALIRAIVCADRPVPEETAPGLWDAALWHAARHGLSAGLIHPPSGQMAPARLAMVAMRLHVSEALDDLGDADAVDAFFERVLRDGSGAVAQWRSRRAGVPALAELYRERISV